ncbi:hypothetical protein [Streptacidiphilus sp. P02-A3a]|nr:hypothetical protein [Streptacidiphilus sp. P02-A3a]
MGASSDDWDARIDVWAEEQLALSPDWSAEKWECSLALLGVEKPE